MFFKKFTILSVSFYLILISLIGAFFYNRENYFLSFIDVSFILSLFLFIVGGFLFVIEKGVFNIFIYSSVRFAKSFNRKKEKMIDDEMSNSDNKDILYRKYDFIITNPFFFGGMTVGIFSMVLSFFYIM